MSVLSTPMGVDENGTNIRTLYEKSYRYLRSEEHTSELQS